MLAGLPRTGDLAAGPARPERSRVIFPPAGLRPRVHLDLVDELVAGVDTVRQLNGRLQAVEKVADGFGEQADELSHGCFFCQGVQCRSGGRDGVEGRQGNSYQALTQGAAHMQDRRSRCSSQARHRHPLWGPGTPRSLDRATRGAPVVAQGEPPRPEGHLNGIRGGIRQRMQVELPV